jgi:hypothetical protein
MGQLAKTYQSLGQFRRAEELKTVVLDRQKSVLGINHPETLHTMEDLSVLTNRQNDSEHWMIICEHQKARRERGKSKNEWHGRSCLEHAHFITDDGNVVKLEDLSSVEVGYHLDDERRIRQRKELKVQAQVENIMLISPGRKQKVRN